MLRNDPKGFGIRARLLTLLLPGILGLLALDSWNDYNGLDKVVQDVYDRSMLESARMLRSGVSLGTDGKLRLDAPAVVQSILEPVSASHKYLHVGLLPLGDAGLAPTRPETTLLGEADLLAPSASTSTKAPVDALAPVWNNSIYKGQPVRTLTLRSEVVDGRGQRFNMVIQVAESTLLREQAQAASLRQQFIRDARMVLVTVLLVWLGVTWSLRPLEQLRKSLLARKGHDLQALDTTGVPHEVAPLVDAVNQHVARYRDLLDEQSQFLAEASHQLRTPLAIMLTQAGVALREENPEHLHATLRAIVVQVSRSRRLCEQLLSLAHASESSPVADAPALADLNRIARDVVLQYLSLAHEKNQDLGWIDAREALATQDESPPGPLEDSGAPQLLVPVMAQSLELHEALSNLVHNAIVYTPAGGRITVSVSTQGGMALAVVQDDGPGIASARRGDVFERFRRLGPASGNAGHTPHGAGLGLPIARAYARRNGGDIELADAQADNDANGLRATLRLPSAG